MNLQIAGTCAAEQHGRRSLVRPGQFTVVDTTEPYHLRSVTPSPSTGGGRCGPRYNAFAAMVRRRRLDVAPFLADSGTPVAAMAYSEPAGSANVDAPPPAEGTRTTAVPDGDDYVINGSRRGRRTCPAGTVTAPTS